MSRGPKPRPMPQGPQQEPPEPPKDMQNETARKEWRRITKLLCQQRVFSDADIAALTIYCTSYATYKHAAQQVEELGSVVMSAAGSPVKNPYVSVCNSCWDRIRPLLAEFGLSPSGRARLKLDLPTEENDNEFF